MKRFGLIILFLFAGNCAVAATPAERAIEQARMSIAKSPSKADGYNTLAIALARRARETSNVAFYTEGEKAVETSLSLEPGNSGALRARAWILLGKHEFAAARDVAAQLIKQTPDDLMVYGFLTDSNAELGDYDAAERACNWMLRLRPGNIPALTRAAYLRELFGDLTGAVDLMTMALDATAEDATEDRAWILVQIAHLDQLLGKEPDAETLLSQALTLFPKYHYALGALGKLRLEQKRYAESADLFRARYEAAPHAENLYDLAETLARAGHEDEAAKLFSQFETQSRAESERADNSNRELILYYAGRGGQPARALELAQHEYAMRHDVNTTDAYAWALHVNGLDAEALPIVKNALRVGTRDSAIKDHAHQIEMASAHPIADSH